MTQFVVISVARMLSLRQKQSSLQLQPLLPNPPIKKQKKFVATTNLNPTWGALLRKIINIPCILILASDFFWAENQ